MYSLVVPVVPPGSPIGIIAGAVAAVVVVIIVIVIIAVFVMRRRNRYSHLILCKSRLLPGSILNGRNEMVNFIIFLKFYKTPCHLGGP